MSKDSQDLKHQTLRQYGALYAAAEAVRNELLLSHEFFDPRDLVQVKYEMLRRVRVDVHSVSQVARDFGFSRTAFYQALALLQGQGLPGLIPKSPWPQASPQAERRGVGVYRPAARGGRSAAGSRVGRDGFEEVPLLHSPAQYRTRSGEAAKKRALDEEAYHAWCRGVSAQAWSDRYEAVRQQAIQTRHPLENGWELANKIFNA